MRCITVLFLALFLVAPAVAQVPPTPEEIVGYTGILAAAARGDAAGVKLLLEQGEDADARDNHGLTPLHVAAYRSHHEVMRALAAGGADPNTLENDLYDIVTIAAVANDVPTLKVALKLGASAGNITSIWDGTALIAAAHLGHTEVVKILIEAGAPLDHVNNLGWTAVIESIVLGDGGQRHIASLRALVDAGADVNIPDRNGQTPLELAQSMGYEEMVEILKGAAGSEYQK